MPTFTDLHSLLVQVMNGTIFLKTNTTHAPMHKKLEQSNKNVHYTPWMVFSNAFRDCTIEGVIAPLGSKGVLALFKVNDRTPLGRFIEHHTPNDVKCNTVKGVVGSHPRGV